MQAQQRAEAKALQRLVMKATRLSIEQVVAIVDMKTEVPDIVCPHCSRGLSTGSELRKALREMQAAKVGPSSGVDDDAKSATRKVGTRQKRGRGEVVIRNYAVWIVAARRPPRKCRRHVVVDVDVEPFRSGPARCVRLWTTSRLRTTGRSL